MAAQRATARALVAAPLPQAPRPLAATSTSHHLASAMRTIAAAATADEAVRAALQAVARAMTAEMAALHLLAHGLSVTRATFSWAAGLQWEDVQVHPRPGSVTEEIVRHLRPVLVPDTSRRSGLPPRLGILGIGSTVHVPLLLGDELIGTLLAGWSARQEASPARLRALQRIARQLLLVFADLRRRIDAERRLQEQAIVAETASAIAAASDQDGALQTLVAGMQRLTGADRCGVRLLADARQPLGQARLFLWSGADRYTWEEVQTLPGSDVARVIATATGVYTPDLTLAAAGGDTAARLAIEHEGVQSSLIAPLCAGGHVIGTLHADSLRPHAFSEAQLPPLQVLADSTSRAVERVRLQEQAAERHLRLEVAERVSAAVNAADSLDSMLSQVLREAAALVGAQRGTVALVDIDRRFVRGRVGFQQPPGLVEATVRPLHRQPDADEDIYSLVVRTGEQTIIEDDHPALHRSTMNRFGLLNWHRVLTPIRHAGEVIGVLTLSWSGQSRPTSGGLATVRLIAEQAGGAIARTRLDGRRREMAEQVAHTLAAVGAAATPEAALEALLRGALTLLHGDDATARMFDPATGEGCLLLRVNPTGTLHRNPARAPLLPGSHAALLQAGGAPLLVPDFQALDPSEYPLYEHMRQQGMRAAVNVPIDADGQRIGSLHVNHRQPDFYSTADLTIAAALASQAGAAIERARLVEAERTHLHARLDAEAKYRAILDTTGEAMVLVSPERQVLTLNRRAEEFFGITEAEAQRAARDTFQQRMAQIFGDLTVFAWFTEEAATPEACFSLELRQRWPREQDLALDATPVFGADGALLGRLYVFRDVTREREVDRMKREFISLVSHELRTPLTSIKGYADLLLAGEVGELSAEQQDFLRIVKNNADREVALINDFLDLSRIEAGKMTLRCTSLDIASLLRGVIVSLRPQFGEKHQRLTLDLPEALPRLWGDADRLTQVFTNLLSNAHKYTPDGGHIGIRVVAGETLLVEVRDDGIGMAADELAQLFTRFFRAENQLTRSVHGTGLGLVITRSLVELHGGQITAQSAPGEGATFTVLLPLERGPAGSV